MTHPMLYGWTEEDECFAAAQWASGVKQHEIGVAFGYSNGSQISLRIRGFISKYGSGDGLLVTNKYGHIVEVGNHARRALVKAAISEFVRQRNARPNA